MEMNNYAIGTIIGTAALSLIKSRVGSNIRLVVTEETFVNIAYSIRFFDYNDSLEGYFDEVVNIVNDFMVDYPMYTDEIYTSDDEYEVDHGVWATQYYLDIEIKSKTIEGSQDEDAITKEIKKMGNILYEKIWQQSNLRYTVDEVNQEEESWTQLETVVYNAETGEVYNQPKSEKSKLRKR